MKQNDNYDNTFTEFYYIRIINRALYRIYQDERLNEFDTNLLKYLQAYDLYNEIGQNKDVVEHILSDSTNNEIIIRTPGEEDFNIEPPQPQ